MFDDKEILVLRILGEFARYQKGVKVCFVSCYPPSRGRLAEYSYYLIAELQRLPWISHIHVIADAREYYTVRKVSDKVTLHRVWKINNVASLLFVPLRVLRLSPDVVHFNVHMAVFGRSRLANFVGLSLPFVCRLMGLKTVVTLHNIVDMIDVEKAGFRRSFINRLGALIATKLLCASTVTVTVKSYVKILERRYRCNKVLWVPHGTWKFSCAESMGCHDRPSKFKVILYFGHSGPYKNLDLLFTSFEILRRRRGDVKLIVAGESHPNYPGFLEKYRKDLPNVEFVGFVPEEKIPSLFKKVDVVVLPYHTCTGTSGVAHLASSYGVPIVATDLPEFRELVEEGCGIVLSSYDPLAFAEKIEWVLSDAEFAGKLRESSLSFARKRTWDKIALQFCEVYAQVVNGK